VKFYDGLIGHDPDVFYNSTGHRCKEIDQVNLRNYLLFVGDNICLGLDKPIEQTFPYIVSKELNMDYYNLSIFNGGFDCMKNNLLTWLTNKPKPKSIILGFEFLNAILKFNEDLKEFEYVDYNNYLVNETLVLGSNCGFFNGRKELFNILLTNINTITPIYQLLLPNRENLLYKSVTNITYDGDIFNHKHISEKLLEVLKVKFDSQRLRP